MPSSSSSSETMLTNMAHESSNEWLDRRKYEDAERQYHEQLTAAAAAKGSSCEGSRPPQPSTSAPTTGTTSARKQQQSPPKQQHQRTQHAEDKADVSDTATVTTKPSQQGKKEKRSKKNENKDVSKVAAAAKKVADKESQPPAGTKIAAAAAAGGQTPVELNQKIAELEAETDRLNKVTDDLRALVLKLETRVSYLEKSPSVPRVATAPAKQPAPSSSKKDVTKDDDVDLFASDDEDDADKERVRQERLTAYEAKKSKKPALIAKSNVILDIKPWDDETDMKEMEKQVRTVAMDGLVWGASKLVPLAYGIHKLQISCVVEDDKVSVDLVQEQIEAFEELVQSVDIASFNKV